MTNLPNTLLVSAPTQVILLFFWVNILDIRYLAVSEKYHAGYDVQPDLVISVIS